MSQPVTKKHAEAFPAVPQGQTRRRVVATLPNCTRKISQDEEFSHHEGLSTLNPAGTHSARKNLFADVFSITHVRAFNAISISHRKFINLRQRAGFYYGAFATWHESLVTPR
jgi:hypothetical protein